MFCNNCGKILKDDAKFCVSCGKEITQQFYGGEKKGIKINSSMNFIKLAKDILKYRWLILICIPILVVIWVTSSFLFVSKDSTWLVAMTGGIGQIGTWFNVENTIRGIDIGTNESRMELPTIYLTNKSGRKISKEYSYIGPFHEGKAVAIKFDATNIQSHGKYAVDFYYINTSGKEIYKDYIEFQESDFLNIRDVFQFNEGRGLIWKDQRYGYIDASGKEIISCVYEELGPFSEKMAVFRRDGKFGYVNLSGKEVVADIYEDARPFYGGLAAVKRDGLWGFIDTKGKEVISCQYDEIMKEDPRLGLNYVSFKDELQGVCRDGEWGFIDKKGKEVISCQYQRVAPFSEGLAAVCRDNEWGFIDKKGKEVIPCRYNQVSDFSEGLVAVREKDKWLFIDKKGNEKISRFGAVGTDFYSDYIHTIYDDIHTMHNVERFLYGVYDKNQQKYYDSFKKQGPIFYNDLAIIKKERKNGDIVYSVMNKQGETISKEYDMIYPFHGNHAMVARVGKNREPRWGYINKKGEEVVACQYFWAFPFSEGLAAVIDKTGDDLVIKYINHKGDIVVSPR